MADTTPLRTTACAELEGTDAYGTRLCSAAVKDVDSPCAHTLCAEDGRVKCHRGVTRSACGDGVSRQRGATCAGHAPSAST
jgi:hypothetical protein